MIKKLDIPIYNNCLGVIHPDMVYFPEGKFGYKYWLFYTTNMPEVRESPCLVRSNDGINFTSEGINNPLSTTRDIDTPLWAASHIADPDVIYDNDMFYLFYTGVSNNLINTSTMTKEQGAWKSLSDTWRSFDSKKAYTCLMTSVDGIEWKKADKPILAYGWEPSLVKVNDEYMMWFSARLLKKDDHTIQIRKSIWLSKSKDLFHWESPIEVIIPSFEWEDFALSCGLKAGLIGHPEAVYHNEQFEMFYLGGTASGIIPTYLEHAISSDGINWTDKKIVFKYEHKWSPYRTTCFYEGDKKRVYISWIEKRTGVSGTSCFIGVLQ